jgi:hypothetical protein
MVAGWTRARRPGAGMRTSAGPWPGSLRVVRRRFGVGYTLAGMDLLLHRIGWSVQVPARRAWRNVIIFTGVVVPGADALAAVCGLDWAGDMSRGCLGGRPDVGGQQQGTDPEPRDPHPGDPQQQSP